MQKEVIILPNKKDLSVYEKYNINTFLLPFNDYSIGYDVYFELDEINELSNKYNIYVLVNKFLHRKISNFRNLYHKFNKNIKFIVEDIGLSDVIEKDRLIMWENHIISNYKAINFLNSIGYNNLVINNDLTIKELREIIEMTNSNLYYFGVCKNMIMYSRRNLVSNYQRYFGLNEDANKYSLVEKVSKSILDIREEKDGSIVRFNKIFCASKYVSELKKSFNIIYDFTLIDELNEKIILENIFEENLCNLIDSDYYFLENDIKYKVGDMK